MQVIIPMAGDGKRFSDAGYTRPKPLIDVRGEYMITAALRTLGIPGRYVFIARVYDNARDNRDVHAALQEFSPRSTVIQLHERTEGAACTCMHARAHVDMAKPLVIANCDQIMDWDPRAFLSFISDRDPDGSVVVYGSDTPKNSYVRVDDSGYACEFAEKRVISDLSLNGIHYWKSAGLFFASAERMIEGNARVNDEFYIAPTYNELIADGMKIIPFRIGADMHHAIGTPEDLEGYVYAHVQIR